MKHLLFFPADRLSQEYRRQRRYLLAVARRILSDDALAEDAVQTAWLNLCRAGYPPEMSPEKWRSYLTVTVKNAAVSILRARGHETEDEAALDVQPDPAPSPEQCAERSEAYQRLYRALAALPEQDQDVLLLKYDNGCTVQQIAALLALPEETVKKRLYRARQKLKHAWEVQQDDL